MNIFVLMAVMAIWLAAVSYMMPLSTLITTRPIEFSIVLAMFSVVGLVLLFANRTEENLDLADDVQGVSDHALPAKAAMAGGGSNESVTFPLHELPLQDGVGG